MTFFNKGTRKASILINIVLIVCFMANIFSGFSPAMAQTSPVNKVKTIIPKNVSGEIYSHANRILNGICEHISKIEGWDAKLYSSFIDDQNRIFFAVKGRFSHKWPFRDIDREHVLKIETDGNIVIDFFLNEASSENGVMTYEFNADAIIMLDDMLISMSKFAVGMGASAAIGFVAKNLVGLLTNIDSKLLAGALTKACTEFSANSFNKSFEALAESLKEYEQKGEIYKHLISGIRNGNFLSFMVFNIINVGAHQATGIAGAAIGSAIGTALFPGAGTIIGGLVSNAASLIITKFVIDKIGSEWLLKLELKRFMNLSGEISSTHSAGTSVNMKYDKRFQNITEKLKDDFDSNKFTKFNTLVSVIESEEKSEIAHLRPIIIDLNEFMQTKILADNDLVASRKYLQLKQAVIKRGMERQFGY